MKSAKVEARAFGEDERKKSKRRGRGAGIPDRRPRLSVRVLSVDSGHYQHGADVLHRRHGYGRLGSPRQGLSEEGIRLHAATRAATGLNHPARAPTIGTAASTPVMWDPSCGGWRYKDGTCKP